MPVRAIISIQRANLSLVVLSVMLVLLVVKLSLILTAVWRVMVAVHLVVKILQKSIAALRMQYVMWPKISSLLVLQIAVSYK